MTKNLKVRDTVTAEGRPGVWLVTEVTPGGYHSLQHIESPEDIFVYSAAELSELAPIPSPYTVADITARDLTPGTIVDIGVPNVPVLGRVESVEHLPFPGFPSRDRVRVVWQHTLPENGVPEVLMASEVFPRYEATA